MFDPFFRWMGIATGPQPLAPHEVLAVAPGEARGEVLEEAALRRVELVRPYQLKYPEESTRALCEIASALEAMRPSQVPARATRREKGRRNNPLSDPGASCIRTVTRRHGRHGTASLLVACQNGAGEASLTAWKIQLTPLRLSIAQKKALARHLRPRLPADHGPNVRIVSRRGTAVPRRTLIALIQSGLASVRRWLLPSEQAHPA
jgi:hypothetical protein